MDSRVEDVAVEGEMTRVDAVTCPRCETRNRADAMDCEVCRINLQFALENPVQIERVESQEPATERWAVRVEGAPAFQHKSILLARLLLLGSFVFAFCLGEAVHELGHYLAHRTYGTHVGIRLDPFGGSCVLKGSSAPQETWGVTSAAGPLLNLLVSVTVSLSLWHYRRPALLPLLLWGPIALVQEGVAFSLGMLTPGGDAQLIVESGVPVLLILGSGVLFLACGVTAVCWVLPLVGLSPSDSFGRRFGVVSGGMVSFMLIRLLGSSVLSPYLAQENAVPLVFALVLAAIVAVAYGPRLLDSPPSCECGIDARSLARRGVLGGPRRGNARVPTGIRQLRGTERNVQ